MSKERMSASAHVGPGAGDVVKNIEQAAMLVEALQYGTQEVMFDGYRLIRKVLLEAVETIDEAILQRMKSEAEKERV